MTAANAAWVAKTRGRGKTRITAVDQEGRILYTARVFFSLPDFCVVVGKRQENDAETVRPIPEGERRSLVAYMLAVR